MERGFDWRYDSEDSGSEYGVQPEKSTWKKRRDAQSRSPRKHKEAARQGNRTNGNKGRLTLRIPTPPPIPPEETRSLSGSQYELELHNDDDDENTSSNMKSPLDRAKAQLKAEQKARQRPPPVLPDGIVIRGNGLTDKEKEDIQRTLGELQRVDVEGLPPQWLSQKNLDQYSYFCAERQRIYERKTADPENFHKPWTEDKIFANLSVSNIFRNQDRTSAYIIDKLIHNYTYDPLPGPEARSEDPRWSSDGAFVDTVEEEAFRLLIFWQFGKKETWEGLRGTMKEVYGTDDICWKDYEEKMYADCLRRVVSTGACLFTGAYQIHPSKTYGAKENFVNGGCMHLRLDSAITFG